MPTFNATVSLKEGMKIAPVSNQEEIYTLIKSSKSNEMYLLFQQNILKLSDVKNLDKDYVCVDLSCFEDEVKVLETENKNFYLIDNDFCIYSFVKKELEDADDKFVNLDLKIVKMTKEEYMLLKKDNYLLKCRDIIEDIYLKRISS